MKRILFLNVTFLSQLSFAGWTDRNVLWCEMNTAPPCNTFDATIQFPDGQDIPDLSRYELKQELNFQMGELLTVDEHSSWGYAGYGSSRLVRDEDAQGPFWGVVPPPNNKKPNQSYEAIIRHTAAGGYQLSMVGCYHDNQPVIVNSRSCVVTNDVFMKLPSFMNNGIRALREKAGF